MALAALGERLTSVVERETSLTDVHFKISGETRPEQVVANAATAAWVVTTCYPLPRIYRGDVFRPGI